MPPLAHDCKVNVQLLSERSRSRLTETWRSEAAATTYSLQCRPKSITTAASPVRIAQADCSIHGTRVESARQLVRPTPTSRAVIGESGARLRYGQLHSAPLTDHGWPLSAAGHCHSRRTGSCCVADGGNPASEPATQIHRKFVVRVSTTSHNTRRSASSWTRQHRKLQHMINIRIKLTLNVLIIIYYKYIYYRNRTQSTTKATKT